jgi:superfamily II DNA or RNA helicase
MARSVRLRPWQKAALERLDASCAPDFLAVATPGAGKTTFALTAARRFLAAAERPARIVVVAPTAHLRSQWARAALGFDLHLEPGWKASDGALPADVHGIVTTYQQVATSAAALRAVAGGAFVVFDEVHHAADDRAWGDAVRHAFEPAARRLALSGTPFRSDAHPIPFVRYRLDEAEADFEYGYGDALRDGRVVRPVYFPRTDGRMEWTAPDGSLESATFEDPLDATRSGYRLRTALTVDGEWLPAVLHRAHRQLLDVRESQPDAGGLVIAIDQEHARGVGRLLRDRIGARCVVVTSDDPTASLRIARFASDTTPWIVAVRMVSEGVDIPRLRVGVLATTTTTELFFRQAVGRLARWTPGTGRQPSFFFIPDDARLRARAFAIAEQRRHSLRREEAPERLLGERDESAPADEQPSLFTPISSVALGEADVPDWAADVDAAVDESEDDEDALVLDLPPVPVVAGASAIVPPERKKQLRVDNAERAKELARLTGRGHAAVNAELNRMAGVRRITEATAVQLERRLRHADAWLRRL